MSDFVLDTSIIRLLHGSAGKPLGGSQGGDNDGGGLRINGGHVIVVPPYNPLSTLAN